MINQNYKNFILFVINDGGDNVNYIINSFNDNRIVYFNNNHVGKAASLNFGLKKVKTKYIGYMDDDDEIYSDHFELLVTAAEKNSKEFVYSDTLLTIIYSEREYCISIP